VKDSPAKRKPASDPLWTTQLDWPAIIHDLGLGHRPRKHLYGAIVFPSRLVQHPKIVKSQWEIGSQANYLVQVAHCLVVIALLHVRDAAVVERRRDFVLRSVSRLN